MDESEDRMHSELQYVIATGRVSKSQRETWNVKHYILSLSYLQICGGISFQTSVIVPATCSFLEGAGSKKNQNSFFFFLRRVLDFVWLSFLVPFALYLQQLELEPVILHGICYILAWSLGNLHRICCIWQCLPSILIGIWLVFATFSHFNLSFEWYLLHLCTSKIHVFFCGFLQAFK